MKYILPIALSLVTFYSTASDVAEIRGSVKDKDTGEPIAGVNIIVKGTIAGTITNLKGEFELKLSSEFPLTITASFIGYRSEEATVTNSGQRIDFSLSPSSILGAEVVVTASRVEESALTSPVAIEKLDLRAIKESASPNFFDALEGVKGVQFTTLSLGFKVPNTRGFTNTTNPRFLQMVDGADTQAPGLGVSIANTVGPNELDVESIEVTPGASSALYGLNALNGISNVLTKSPFIYQGLGVYQKVGVNHVNDADFSPQVYTETGARFAKAYNNRFAFKINIGFQKGTDWVANDLHDLNPLGNSSVGLLGTDNPAKDPINSYGNESSYRKNLTLADGKIYQVARTGYAEKDLVNHNYGIRNPKGDLSLHYRLSPKAEVSYTYRIGESQSIFQRGNRIRLDGYQIQQHRIELKGVNYFVRSYLTVENTTDSYNLGPAGAAMDKAFKSDNNWYADYKTGFQNAYNQGLTSAQSNQAARAYADAGRLQPGTQEFNSTLNQIIHVNNWDTGAQLILKNKLLHVEGQYDFKTRLADILVGADARNYFILPDGNSFLNPDTDHPYDQMNYYKFGGFVQATKKVLNGKLKMVASARVDKTEYFNPKLNPRLALVYTFAEKHNVRLSIQNGYRFPTLFEGFSAVNNGGVYRYGGIDILTKPLQLFENSYVRSTVDAFQKAIANDVNTKGKTPTQATLDNQNLLVVNTYTYLKPEEITSFDVGYKSSVMDDKLFLDLDAYYNIYNNFIDQIEISVPNAGKVGETVGGIDSTIFQVADKSKYKTYRMWTNAKSIYFNYGATAGARYNFYRKFSVSGNVSYAALQKIDSRDTGLETPFNTPKYIVNLSLSNRELVKNIGFSVSWRWQDSFVWKSQLANGTVAAYQTIDAQITYKAPRLFSSVKIGGSNLLNQTYTQYTAGPSIGAFYYVTVALDGLLK
ncbi:MAG TPA: TonB-dependent receptor [Cyclobacteriaceae bacterium]|nr:TonB-dependent receptor [Cyclobacteriaceae bacterium]